MSNRLQISPVIVIIGALLFSIGAKGCLWWRKKKHHRNVVTGSSGNPAQVTSPNPADTATDIPITQQLGWAAASGATSYDVYLDTVTPPTTKVITTTNTIYNPVALTYTATYYWQIDAKNSAGTTTGNIWSFQTEDEPVVLPDQVTSPNPADTATDIPITQQLGWAAANGATSYDVYFDTVSPPSYVTNTAITIYNPVALTYSTTYYWQIASINSVGTVTSTLWSFQTGDESVVPPDQVTSPNPAHGAIDVPIATTLTWAAANGATSYDVYFCSSAPPPTYKTNITGTSYSPGSLRYITTYYWRIDSENSAGTTTGNDWNFRTIQPWTEKLTDGDFGFDGDAPSQRQYHPLVWDGTKAIIFGGYGYLGVVQNDLWWYEPVSNTWTKKIDTNDPDSPPKRLGCSMVWTNTKAIMFGGWINGMGLGNDIWWYYPVTNTWVEMTPGAVTPSARQNHSMVWDGTRVILFGGIDGGNDLWWYEPVSNTWTEKIADGDPDSPSGRSGHSMVWDGTRVILFSGQGGGDDLWWYEPVSNTWTEKIADGAEGSAYARKYYSMIWDGTRVVVFAGSSLGGSRYNDLWWYDPGNNEWTEKMVHAGYLSSPIARKGHAMIWDGTKGVMFGGIGFDGGYRNDLWWYEP